MSKVTDIPAEIIVMFFDDFCSMVNFCSTCILFRKIMLDNKQLLENLKDEWYVKQIELEKEKRIRATYRIIKINVDRWLRIHVQKATQLLNERPIFVVEGTKVHRSLLSENRYTMLPGISATMSFFSYATEANPTSMLLCIANSADIGKFVGADKLANSERFTLYCKPLTNLAADVNGTRGWSNDLAPHVDPFRTVEKFIGAREVFGFEELATTITIDDLRETIKRDQIHFDDSMGCYVISIYRTFNLLLVLDPNTTIADGKAAIDQYNFDLKHIIESGRDRQY